VFTASPTLQDSICTAGLRTTAGSRVLDTYLPPFDATAVARLKAAGAVLIGKTNLDEFCMGSSTENSAYQVRPASCCTNTVITSSDVSVAAAIRPHYCHVSFSQ
jgi:aspartyl-tRNA(Asn)/glutamyl-tRNA(Gln) amidotransferase subunit A